MADLANLVLAVDSTSVPKATAALDGLTVAGARAEAATIGLGVNFKGAGAGASQMAVAAQLSARAAMDQAAGFKASSDAARVNTLAMRETLVVARELSRGNFTRLPGSLTLLAQGVGSQGGFGAYASALASTLGLVKQVQNAELAEAATAAATAAAGVEGAAARAGANILAADTQVALAEAAIRTAATAEAEALAQAQLAVALEAVTVASAEAAIAENALAVAQGRATEASAASAAATRTVIGTTGGILIGATVAAVGLVGAFKALQATVDDNGSLDRYAQSLVKTKDQLQELSDKVGGFQVTWGDVFHGLAKAAGDALGTSSIWDSFKEGNKNAFTEALHTGVDWAANIYGVVRGTYQSIVDIWTKFPGIIGDAFYSAVNVAIEALNKLVKNGVDQLNGFIATANKLPFVHLGNVGAPQIGAVGNPYAGQSKALGDALSSNIPKFTSQAKAEITKNLGTVYDDIIGASEDRIRSGLGKPPKAKKPKKEPRNPADDEISKLNAQIASENALAQAYLTSDAAALKAEADQKAMVLAVEKHANGAQTAALKEKELALAIATASAAGAKEISNLTFEAGARQKVNAMVAAGLIPASQASSYLQLETQLRPLIAAQSLAEGAAKAALTNEITKLTAAYADNQAQINIGQAQQQIAANDNEIAQIRLKNNLLGQSNTEIATALANLQTMQYLKDHPGIDAGTAADLANTNVQKALLTVQSPFQQWAQGVPNDAKAINDALESIAFKGFDSIGSALADVITGTKSLGAAFRDIAHQIISDIIQMTVKMLIFRAISGIFGGLGSGGSVNVLQSGDLSFANSGASALSTLPNIAPPRASGGPVSAGQLYQVNEKGGPEYFRPSSGGSVIPLGQTPANNNQSGPIEITIGFGDAPDFAPYVQQVSATHAAEAIKIAVNHTNQTLRTIARPKLN